VSPDRFVDELFNSSTNTYDPGVHQRIVSFDIGIKNMAMCVSDITTGNIDVRIHRWKVFHVNGKNIEEYTVNLIRSLRHETLGVVDSVLIELQLSRNTQMKVMSHVIQCFFVCEYKLSDSNIFFVNSKLRFKTGHTKYDEFVKTVKHTLGLDDKLSRREYKMLSVAVTRGLLNGPNQRWLEYYESHSKKDDLADSYLQIVTWNANRVGDGVQDIDMIVY